MKIRSILILLLVLTSLIAVNAYADEQKETVTLTGKVYVTNRMKPELIVGNDKYLLMMPRFVEMKDGDEITVEGFVEKDFIMPHDYYYGAKDNIYLFVTKVNVSGKSYELDELKENWQGKGPWGYPDYPGRWPRGGRGRGPGYCW